MKAILEGDLDCNRQPQIESWLRVQARKWHKVLLAQTGYEMPDAITVCKIDSGNPFADLERNRIFFRSVDEAEDRITLAHEYLHLAFKYHPLGMDERFIESLARELALQ